jgi:hypothetical protein
MTPRTKKGLCREFRLTGSIYRTRKAWKKAGNVPPASRNRQLLRKNVAADPSFSLADGGERTLRRLGKDSAREMLP